MNYHEIRVKLKKEVLEWANNETLTIKLYDENIGENHFGIATIIEPEFSNLESNYIILIDDDLKIKSIKPVNGTLEPLNKNELMIFEEEINQEHDYIIRLFYRMHLPKDWEPNKIRYQSHKQTMSEILRYYVNFLEKK